MNKPRLHSIDLLRGLIMVIMALDHVRDFFYFHTIDPTNLEQTTPVLFFTRWITHFCAPTFILLAGVGAALSRLRGKSPTELTCFLITRGVWLIFLEWMVVRTFGWAWNFDFAYLPCWVIWTLGWSMIMLGILSRFPNWVPIVFGLTLIFGHHLVDHIKGEQISSCSWLWHILHDPCDLVVPKLGLVVKQASDHGVVIHTGYSLILMKQPSDNPLPGVVLSAGYPLIPWVGVMAVGYGLGMTYGWEAKRRRRLLYQLGLACCLGFVLLRFINGYGETSHWAVQPSPIMTFISFLNCTKQPPSLCYLLMTLGPALLFLAWFDAGVGRWARPLIIFGKVPLFFYLLHLPLIHGLWVIAAWWHLHQFPAWLFSNPPLGHVPHDFGFSLPVVYAVWVGVILMLYPLCHWYAGIKQRHKSVWLSYL
ncbi:MAG TPA: heparan-alpha-glucosaminide N-acetyltransferase domain-containing protein [Gemmatales bacterium]|nr:heparan-alpha-glucosaminide N-acetyltransferase domain-containing protein [Gemmatales bacterium]